MARGVVLLVCNLAVQLTVIVCTDVILDPNLVCEPRYHTDFSLDIEEEGLKSTSVCDSNFIVISKTYWNGRLPKSPEYMNTPVSIVFIHHTVMSECFTPKDCAREVKNVQDFHMNKKGWDDIGYSFIIGGDGNAYEGRGWDRVGAHTLGWNNISVSFAVMGDYTDHLPTKGALDALTNLMYRGVALRKLTPDFKLFGHRDARPTESPGEELYKLIKTYSHYGPLPLEKPKQNPPK